MEACRSDKAAAVVQLHPRRLHSEIKVRKGSFNVFTSAIETRGLHLSWGRGVTAAQQTFNLPGGGSNPSDLISDLLDSTARSSTVRAGSL